MSWSPRRLAATALSLGCAAVCACGGSGSATETDAQQVLTEARQAVDATSALHFKLDSQGASGSGVVIEGGEGDAVRPNGFTGSFDVTRFGLNLTIKVVSAGGTFYVEPPFSTGFQKTDPSSYGFSDPGRLIDPNVGLSSLLSSTLTRSLGDRDRLQGEELYEVSVTLPGQKVKDLLTSADPSQTVSGTVGVAVDTHQVRRVVLTGPFFEKGKNATFTLVLTNYGETVSVTPPPG